MSNSFDAIQAAIRARQGETAAEDGERACYREARSARTREQSSLLLTGRRFHGDAILRALCRASTDGAATAGAASSTDPRSSLIFIARPPAALAEKLAGLQSRLVSLFEAAVGTEGAGVWTTPLADLHMTLLDVVSCVAEDSVEERRAALTRPGAGPVSDIVRAAFADGPVVLGEAAVMVDGNAIAVSWLPRGHVRVRSALWEGVARRSGRPPVMRYVSTSAHVTLCRFTRDLHTEPERMATLLQDIRELSEEIRQTLDWKIDTDNVDCVYGRVYYGGGTVLP